MNITGLLLEEKQKKKLVALLLLISCVTSTLLLAFTSTSSVLYLQSFEQADSLIVNNLDKFNVSNSQIRVRSVRLDSIHTRKTYRVAVPPGFSKTQLHLELAQAFYPFGVGAPARVVFPQEDMIIHLVNQNTVFRSVELHTDPNLIMERNYGSILVAFDSLPSEKLLEKVISFGEPIPLALIVDNPMTASELVKNIEDKYSHILFWLKDEEGNNILNNKFAHTLPRLQQLQEVIPDASVLSFLGLVPAPSPDFIQLLSRTSLSYVDASEAIMLDSDTGHAAFQQELNKFIQKAKRNEHPVAIVRGNNKSLNWLQDELADFKKAGLDIVLPRRKQF